MAYQSHISPVWHFINWQSGKSGSKPVANTSVTVYRVVNVWNSLPDYVVVADSLNSFKSRLDKYWANQELVFNFNSELIGTGGLPVCM